MSKPSPRPPDGEAPPRDWFLPAIEANGSVAECLQAVLDELDGRAAFVRALKTALDGGPGGHGIPHGLDALSGLSQRIRALENTLRFRLGILRPDRPLAWFRAPAATSTGPFASTLIDEPVFAAYEPADAERLRRDIVAAWTKRTDAPLAFKDDARCLWRTLLGFNAELTRVTQLRGAFVGLKLDVLPDELPPSLESRALRAFLINVRNEVKAARERLDACHKELWETSEKLWAAQLAQTAQQAHQSAGASHAAGTGMGGGGAPRDPFGGAPTGGADARQPPRGGAERRARGANPAAETMREEFKKRRQVSQSRPLMTPADRDALRFMGFDEYPSADGLRQRYLSMAKKLHPDLQGGSDGAFKLLNNAYSHLTGRIDAAR